MLTGCMTGPGSDVILHFKKSSCIEMRGVLHLQGLRKQEIQMKEQGGAANVQKM